MIDVVWGWITERGTNLLPTSSRRAWLLFTLKMTDAASVKPCCYLVGRQSKAHQFVGFCQFIWWWWWWQPNPFDLITYLFNWRERKKDRWSKIDWLFVCHKLETRKTLRKPCRVTWKTDDFFFFVFCLLSWKISSLPR